MRIAVIGAGAIGGVMATCLALAGRNVVLVARGQMLERLKAGQLLLEGDGQPQQVRVEAIDAQGLDAPIDLAICCVKTPDLASALPPLASVLAPDGAVLMVQNGVEAHEEAAALLPGRSVVASRMHGFFEAERLTVRHVGVPPSLYYGCTSGDPDRSHKLIETAFGQTGIAVTKSGDIQRDLWEKFMLSASLGGVGCALGVPAGLVWATAGGPDLLRDAMEEVAALARHVGVALTPSHVEAMLAFSRSFPPDATTSLQRDVEAGKPSEYRALSGAVARIARTAGFAVEIFPRLDAIIASRYPQAAR